MNAIRVAEIIGLVIMAMFGSAGFWTWLTSRKEKRKIYDEAYKAGIEGSSVLDKRAVSLLDPYVQQVKYLSAELEASRAESRAARQESAASRVQSESAERESRSLRVELAAAMTRIADLENVLISHGLATNGG